MYAIRSYYGFFAGGRFALGGGCFMRDGIVGYKTLKPPDADRLAFYAAHAELLALCFLRTHAAADGGKAVCLSDFIISVDISYNFV